MLNVLMFALGTGGDIDPMVALGSELKNRGHRVTVLSNDYFIEAITSAGLDFVSVGTVKQYQRGNSVQAWESHVGADNFEFYYAPSFEPSYNYVKSQLGQERLVVVALDEGNGAAAAAVQYGVPFVRVFLSPNLLFSAISPPAPRCWNLTKKLPRFIVRALLRLSRKYAHINFCEAPHVAGYIATRKCLGCPLLFKKKSDAMLQLAFFPEWFGMRPKDWPADLKCVGFHLANRPNQQSREEVDVLFERFTSPIIFTYGSGIKNVSDIFREGRKMCEQLKIPGLFVGGEIGKELLEGSDWCAYIKFIDFEYAFPKARAVVHHGGIGTTAQAIKAGIPQLVRPIKHDQPDNANRVAKLGLGAYVLPDFFQTETVVPVLSSLLAQAAENTALKKYSSDVRKSSAIAEACTLIEQAMSETKACSWRGRG